MKRSIWKQKTWVCLKSADLPRIKYPLHEAEEAGELEFVDAPEIAPELIAEWIGEQMGFYSIPMLALDDYRFALMKQALARYGFTYENKKYKAGQTFGQNKSRADHRQRIQKSQHSIRRFVDHAVVYEQHKKSEVKKKYGNYEYQKIEAKKQKRQTAFFAFVAAMTQHELIPEQQGSADVLPLFTM